ncbi:MAG: alpha-amylase [Asgard group archaeon]|nr:alpha-amylase [Asgard group archaeon]
MSEQFEWWQKAVFYQIYPRSFYDSTNNGIGDLRGIINKFDYLIELGIDAIWFSPFYPSPQDDFGYDITDFGSINPDYGTMKDFDELLKIAHENDVKIILDMVLNHTSNKHPWFLKSKLDKINDKHDWYVWLDGKGKEGIKAPNNWRALIGGSAWEWSEERQQFYLHQFLKCQPDLNWRNPRVQEVMFNYIRFWLDKGVDGYRLDIIHTLFEDKEFRDNPKSKQLFPTSESLDSLLQSPKYTQFLPETEEICIKLSKIIDEYKPVRMLVGEATGGPKLYRSLYGNNNGLNTLFNFQFGEQKFSAKAFYRVLMETEKLLPEPYWPCNVFSNHDAKRMISRIGNNEEKARLLTLLLLTARGTPFIYYGEEIGIPQVKVPKKKQKDPISNHWVFGIPVGWLYGRDGCRTPMQWNNSPINAGFSADPNIEPWLPVGSTVELHNVEYQKNTPYSMLDFYKQLIRVRKNNESLQIGSIILKKSDDGKYLIFERKTNDETSMIILNFDSKIINIELGNLKGKQIFSTIDLTTDKKLTSSNISLRPYEGIIIKKMN